jgi:hypothetical protein
VTGIQQTVPASPLAGRRFRAYTAKHLDALTARAGQPFFARFDPGAVWLSDLAPAFATRFPFESGPEELPGLWDQPILVPVS